MTLGGINCVIVLIPPWHDKFCFPLPNTLRTCGMPVCILSWIYPKTDILPEPADNPGELQLKCFNQKYWGHFSIHSYTKSHYQLIIEDILGNMLLLSLSFHEQQTYSQMNKHPVQLYKHVQKHADPKLMCFEIFVTPTTTGIAYLRI